jgi:hypothetical protein
VLEFIGNRRNARKNPTPHFVSTVFVATLLKVWEEFQGVFVIAKVRRDIKNWLHHARHPQLKRGYKMLLFCCVNYLSRSLKEYSATRLPAHPRIRILKISHSVHFSNLFIAIVARIKLVYTLCHEFLQQPKEERERERKKLRNNLYKQFGAGGGESN